MRGSVDGAPAVQGVAARGGGGGIAVMKLHGQLLQLAELFDCVEDVVVWVKDRDGRYRWVNRAFLINYSLDDRRGRTGLDPADVLGKTDYDLSPAFLADQFRLDDEYVLAGQADRQPDRDGRPARRADRLERHQQDPAGRRRRGGRRHGGHHPEAGHVGRAIAPGSEFGPVLAYMRDHYHTPITNRQLARLAHMSVRAFERKFHGSFHLTPQKYLRKLRMRMASRALVYTGQTLAEVASAAASPIKATSPVNSAAISADTPRDYREHYAREAAAMPLLFQILPLTSKNRPGPCRYSPPSGRARAVSSARRSRRHRS